MVTIATIAVQITSEPADHTDAVLAVFAAIVVALIAAGTAQWRLHAQLANDRKLADLTDLREVLERALATTDAWDRELEDQWGPRSTSQINFLHDQKRTDEARQDTERLLNRLTIRVGTEDPLVAAYDRVRSALLEKTEAVQPGPEARAGDVRKGYQDADLLVKKRYRAFVDESKARVESKVDLARRIGRRREPLARRTR